MTKDEVAEMLSAIKEDQESRQSKRKTWSPPSDQEGNFKIRILPPLKRKGEKVFYSFYRVHWINRTPFLCLNQKLTDKNGELHTPEECPICSYVAKLYNTAGSNKECDEYKIAGTLSARDRYLYRVVVRGSEDETIPVLWESSKTMYGALVAFMTSDDPDKNYGVIVDPLSGRDFVLTKVGKGKRSNYDQSVPSKNETPIFPDKEKITKVILNAEKLEYSSLFEFQPKEALSTALKNYISGDNQSEGDKQQAPKQSKPVDVSKEDTAEEAESDDAIDDLLKDLF